jgi:hypothetical protein
MGALTIDSEIVFVAALGCLLELDDEHEVRRNAPIRNTSPGHNILERVVSFAIFITIPSHLGTPIEFPPAFIKQ